MGRGWNDDGAAYTLEARRQPQAIAFDARQDPCVYGDVAGPLTTKVPPNGILSQMHVRRITPLEAERLQGLPDGWTAVRYQGRPMADGPRCRLIGNGMAVNVMRWIGERIALMDDVLRELP